MTARIPGLVDRLLRRLGLTRRGVTERQVSTLRQELTDRRAEVEQARAQRDTAQQIARDLRQRGNTALVQLETARAEATATREEFEAQRDQITAQRREIAVLRDEIKTRRAEFKAQREQIKARHEDVRILRDEGKRRSEEAREVRDKLRRMRATIGAPVEEFRAILPIRAAAAATRQAPDHLATEDQFAALSPAYAEARDAWRRGDRPAVTHHVIDGLHISRPDDGGSEEPAADALSLRLASGWLPLEDIVRVRPFAVGGVMLDIGGNIGTTCIPRIVFGDFARAYAAEPDANNYRCLVGNALDNGLAGRVLPDRVAISSSNGTARLRRAPRIGTHRLLIEGQEWAGDVNEVPCLTIDTWLATLGVAPESIGFVKVDTQGWDAHALAGAPGLLARREIVWQIEVSPRLMAEAGSSVAELAALVARHFTHIKELESTDGRGLRPSSDLVELVNAIEGRKRFTNLLLLNAGP